MARYRSPHVQPAYPPLGRSLTQCMKYHIRALTPHHTLPKCYIPLISSFFLFSKLPPHAHTNTHTSNPYIPLGDVFWLSQTINANRKSYIHINYLLFTCIGLFLGTTRIRASVKCKTLSPGGVRTLCTKPSVHYSPCGLSRVLRP